MSDSVLRPARFVITLLTAAALVSGTAAAASGATDPPRQQLDAQQAAVAGSGNPAPNVVPSLREWSGGTGALTLDEGSRIVVDRGDEQALAGAAQSLRDDVAGTSGLSLPVVSAPKPGEHDIFLSLHGADPTLGAEGYGLTVGHGAEVRGDTDTGVFYGTQTLLQILKTTPGHRSLPVGSARDWPSQQERGFLLDAGRKYWSPDYVVQEIREMAYLRLNTLQLHLTDNNAFRLVSDQFPNLAAPQAYTKADIARFVDVARKYHVTIVPEIEMPAHAQAILNARPDLGFDCPSMGGSVLDVTKPATRQLTTQLIDEFAPLFPGPEFHIATDEYPTQVPQSQCPELADYAKAHGLSSPSDVFVDFINAMNKVVRAHNKRTVIWNWWDVDQNPTIGPDKNIKVEAWTTNAGTSAGHSAQRYLDMGYDVVASPSDSLYVTPQFPLLPDSKFLYEQWVPLQNPHLSGYQISVWADNADTRPDSYFDADLRRPREVIADRLWGGPRQGTVADFFARADAIGTPVGVASYVLPGKLTGTAYGTGPAWDNSTSTFDKAFDGDPTTDFLYSQPNGGYTGLDLGAGHESAVSTIRFFPRGGGPRDLSREAGGHFEGCTDGPTAGCHTLATITTAPNFGWNELSVSDTGHYRWVRYVSPDGGYDSIAEIEFLAPPAGSQFVTIDAPTTLRQLGDNHVVTTYRNTGTHPVQDIRLGLTASATQDLGVRDVHPLGDTHFPTVRPGETVSTTWQVDVPLTAETGAYHLLGRATYQDNQQQGQQEGAPPLQETAAFTSSTLSPAVTAQLDPGTVTLDRGQSQDSKLQITNTAARPVQIDWHEVRFPTGNPGFTLQPQQGTVTVPAGGTASATLTESAAATTSGTTQPVRVDLAARTEGQPATGAGSVQLRVISTAGTSPFTGEYFSNPDLSGTPTLTRTDQQIDFDWGLGSPDPSIPVDHFSARWTGTITPATTGNYTFSVTSDDGTRVFVNGVQVIDNWRNQAAHNQTATIPLTGGQPAQIKVEYYDNVAVASVTFGWQPATG